MHGRQGEKSYRPPLEGRSSGILLHVTSLPSRFGIGDLGPEAFDWIEALARARQTYWQILPLGPTVFVGICGQPESDQSGVAGGGWSAKRGRHCGSQFPGA